MNKIDEEIDLKPAKEKKKRIHKCSICNFQAQYASSIRRHKKVHLTQEERELFACSYCDNKYISKPGLKNHLYNNHSESRAHVPQKKVYRCSTCSYYTIDKSYIEKHKKSHLTREERQIFACEHCDNDYTTKSGLGYHLENNHIDSRTRELKESQKKVYICTICGFQTRYRINLRYHKKIHLAPEQRQLFSCAQCDNTYRTKTGLKYHLRNTHIDSRMQKNVYRCSTCSFQTQEKPRLNRHEKVHLAPEERQLFACAHCDKKYTRKESLIDHLRDNHNRDARAKELRESQKEVHKCAMCGFQTRHKSSLRKHQKIHLAPEERRVFACAQCDRKYMLQGSLEDHINICHIDSKSKQKKVYRCAICSFQTGHRVSLHYHKRVHMAPEEREMFICAQCNNKYKTKRGLLLHLKHGHVDSRTAESPTDEVILDSLKMEIDDYTPHLDDFKNAERIAVTNKVKTEDFLKIELDDDTPIVNTEMHHDLRNTENLSITKKLYIKLVDFLKIEIDDNDTPILNKEMQDDIRNTEN
ncbi:zinc finger protein 354B-like [Sitophilus oryzae]|uniref:Zinc finger protein 354B-like n=1 Tax=Sitophilus oryzae TaxID=7048 RepID=A0A6J2XPF6_SITOR|nr:zinc finger protein 354B-like [Sitophilus oryzae]XP_030752956.1 zinc finger protein 354B-like [Sitophilus oryzae]